MSKIILLIGALSCVSTPAAIISLSNTTTGNFDGNSGTRTVTFTGSENGFGLGKIIAVSILVEFAKADGETFSSPYPTGTPYFNEVKLTLTSPLGSVSTLINSGSFSNGASGTFFDGSILFIDTASTAVNVNAALIQPGTFKPITTLNVLNSNLTNAALGTWTLLIQDTASQDSLRFKKFTLNVTTDGVAVPESSLRWPLLSLLPTFAVWARTRRNHRL